MIDIFILFTFVLLSLYSGDTDVSEYRGLTSAECTMLLSSEYRHLSEHEKRNWARYYVAGSKGVYENDESSIPQECVTLAVKFENAIIGR